jgi:ribosomal protein S18 acetylase RimI-like enzyme
MSTYRIEPLSDEHRHWVRDLLMERWGSTQMVARGELFDVSILPGFAAFDAYRPIGLLTYRIIGGACEVTSLDSLEEGKGVGADLIAAVKEAAEAAGCRRVWLTTTNDNTPALRFYQKRGFHLVAVYPNALEQSRRLKPQIPLIGLDGIPLRDEIELELPLLPGDGS